jgi:hypothetical protein
MQFLARCLLIACMTPLAGMAQTVWQTTRNGSCSGNCQLESDKITMTINPFHLDVEEEAVLGAHGDVSWGDPATLEIVGTFTFAPGTTFRSLLLWNGQKILKAKLKERGAADTAYQQVVNRQIPRDPALVEYLGNGTYRYRLFPVAANGSRRIRILYSIPLRASGEGWQFQINPAFTVGAAQAPTQIPVEFRRSPKTAGAYILAYGTIRKTIQFGATYQIPYSDLVQYVYSYWGYASSPTSKSILIAPDSLAPNCAYSAILDSGKAAGYYTAVFATPPDSITAAVDELSPVDHPSLEAKIVAGSKAYITDFNGSDHLGVYLKSSAPWDSSIYWTVYDSRGKIAAQCRQAIAPKSDSLTRCMLPHVWGARYSLVEGLGNMGSIFGFVDQQMSLLALESDTLCRADAVAYAESGVPALQPNEIFIRASQSPVVPRENIIFEFGSGVVTVMSATALEFSIVMQAKRLAALHFANMRTGAIRAMLLDLNGRVIHTWDTVPVHAGSAQLSLPAQANGCMILRVFSGGMMLQKRITVIQ